MIDRDADHTATGAPHERGHEPVHMIEVRKLEKQRSIEHLETTPGIRRSVTEDARANGVGDARRETDEPRIAALDSVPGHECARAIELGGLEGSDQARDVVRVVLPIPVERGDSRGACVHYAGAERRALAASTIVPQHADARIVARQFGQAHERRIRARVVDKDDLVFDDTRERGIDVTRERTNVVLLIMHRDDHRDVGDARQEPGATVRLDHFWGSQAYVSEIVRRRRGRAQRYSELTKPMRLAAIQKTARVRPRTACPNATGHADH